MVQYSNKAKSCSRSEKDGTILKQGQYLSTSRKKMVNTQTEQQGQNLSTVRKYGAILKQNKPVTSHKKMVQYPNKTKTRHQSEKDGTILKQCQNLS